MRVSHHDTLLTICALLCLPRGNFAPSFSRLKVTDRCVPIYLTQTHVTLHTHTHNSSPLPQDGDPPVGSGRVGAALGANAFLQHALPRPGTLTLHLTLTLSHSPATSHSPSHTHPPPHTHTCITTSSPHSPPLTHPPPHPLTHPLTHPPPAVQASLSQFRRRPERRCRH